MIPREQVNSRLNEAHASWQQLGIARSAITLEHAPFRYRQYLTPCSRLYLPARASVDAPEEAINQGRAACSAAHLIVLLAAGADYVENEPAARQRPGSCLCAWSAPAVTLPSV